MPLADSTICADCHVSPGVILVRTRYLCPDCFSRYVHSKILKRMESYRFKNQPGQVQAGPGTDAEIHLQPHRRRLLLPLSSGISSMILLQVLDAQVRKQLAQQNRTAYDLVVCHVFSLDHERSEDEAQRWVDNVGKIFSLHEYPPPVPLHTILSSSDPTILSGLSELGLSRQESESSKDFLSRILTSPSTSTARTDLYSLLLKHLIVHLAEQHNCVSILWGHSDSRLASLTLSSVAKGRGGAVAEDLADGPSPFAGGMNFNHPVRDLFKHELELYVENCSPELKEIILDDTNETDAPVSLKQTSIDQLLTRYITDHGKKYPGIMANVVRTAGKLQTDNSVSTQNAMSRCLLCRALVALNDQGGLCYGCKRLKQDVNVS